ncbi:MAG: kynureninase [Alphaproteobacteria bacterium]|nr:kynureninase [Alphaproteobacteria bacterium]
MIPDLQDAQRLDAEDPLAPFRDRFDLPPGVLYLDGNSLGALPSATPARLAEVMRQEWGQGLIRSWNTADWIGAPQRVGGKIARLIGAQADEVIVADSTSVNLFKLLSAGLTAAPGRRVILSETGNFPTDLYIAQGIAAMDPSVSVRALPRDEIIAAAGPETIVMLTHVHYKTGQRYDLRAVTQAVQARGGMILWDLSHSAGAVALELSAAGVDLAVGCGYKYLNGGPGAPAFLYVARRHQATLRSPLSGWMGHAAPFAFSDDYAPAPDLKRFLCGTPPILSLAALECGVDLFLEADMTAVTEKSQRLCDLFITWVEAHCAGHGLTLLTPRHPAARGSHVSFAHPDGYAVMQALIARGVIGDFRDPDAMRFGFTPLYLGYVDVWRAVQALKDILTSRAWDDPRYAARAAVT